MNRTMLVLLGRDLLEDLLDPFLELAAVLRARHHGVDRQLDEALVAQALRHLAGDDALGEPLDDRGLADARLADQHRVVLLAPGQHLDRRLDLLRPSDHRVELALAGELRQIPGVLVEVRGVGRRVDPALLGAAADDLRHLLADRLGREPVAAQHVGRDAFAFLGKPDQEVLGPDIGMAEARARPRKRGRARP